MEREGNSVADAEGQEHLVRLEEEPGLWAQVRPGAKVSPWGLQTVPRGFHHHRLGNITFNAGERCDLSLLKF